MQRTSLLMSFVFFSLAATFAISQAPVQDGGFGKDKGKGGQTADHVTLFQNPQVRAELKLTDQQLADFPAAAHKALAEILDAKQMQRLREIYLQQKGIAALLEKDVAKEVKLTEDQSSKIKKALDDQAKKQAAMMASDGFDPAKMQELQKAATAAIQETLTAEQKAAWTKLVGQPFQMAKGGAGGGKGKGAAAALSEQQLLADFKAPKEFNVSIFAKHPDVDAAGKLVGINYPTAICTTPTAGMIFVASDGNASLGTGPGRGKIFRVTDSTGTGKADTITLFCEVDHPRGVIYHNGALFVCHPPDFSAFYDDDGDGKADRHEVLIKGVSSPKTVKSRGGDHTTNNITMGIDGWIYIAVGDFGMAKAVATKDGATVTMHGGIARIRPDGTGFETVVWNTRNIYGVAIDPFMNMFTRDNTNDGGGWNVRLNHDIPTANYGYPSLFVNFKDEILDPLVDYGNGGPTGAAFIDEPSLPEPYGNTLYTVDWGRNAVFRHVLEPSGASFRKSPKQIEFLKLSRPVNLESDGMGRLYATSLIGAQFNYVGPNAGYVAQLVHKDVKPTAGLDWKKLDDRELLKHLTGPGAVQRQHAEREILRRGDKETTAQALAQAATSNAPLPGRVAALFTLKLLRGQKSYPVLAEFAKKDDLREFALKALADDKEHRAAAPIDLFVTSLKDPDPRVRLQAVIGLGRIGNKDAADKLIPLVGDADPSVAHIAYRNLYVLGAAEPCLRALDAGSSDAVIHGSSLVLQLLHDGKVVDGLINKLDTAADSRVRQGAIRALARLYYDEKPFEGTWWGTRPSTKGPYFQPVKWSESERIAGALARAIKRADNATLGHLLAEITRSNVPIAGKNELIIRLAGTDPKYRSQAVSLLASQDELTPEGAALLQKTVLEKDGQPALQAKALQGLQSAALRGKNYDAIIPVLASLTGAQLAPQVKAARDGFLRDATLADAAAEFGRLTQSADANRRELGYRVMIQIAGNLQLPVVPRNLAAKYLEEAWTKPAMTISLLRAIGDAEAEEYLLQIKQHLTDSRAEVKDAASYAAKRIDLEALEKAAKSGSRVGTMAYEDVVAKVMGAKGSAERGARLFAKQGCVVCHTVSPLETPKGPHLEDIGNKQKREELLESILKPSAKIAQGFEPWIITLDNGKLLTGFIVREAGDEIELRNVGGISTIIPKASIDGRERGNVSIMPEGLVSALTIEDLTALVAYLESLRNKN